MGLQELCVEILPLFIDDIFTYAIAEILDSLIVLFNDDKGFSYMEPIPEALLLGRSL